MKRIVWTDLAKSQIRSISKPFAMQIFSVLFVKQETALSMMLSVYVTLGIFLLLASRNPLAPSQPHCLYCVV